MTCNDLGTVLSRHETSSEMLTDHIFLPLITQKRKTGSSRVCGRGSVRGGKDVVLIVRTCFAKPREVTEVRAITEDVAINS